MTAPWSRLSVLSLLLALTPALAAAQTFSEKALKKQELYATIATSKGDIVVKLLSKKAPKTVANFVGLATGEKQFTDPATGTPAKRPWYDGVIFHRVIKDFMIQTGDPTGTGRGGPGYTFEDEVDDALRFDKVGRVAMANRGPNTNGAQFFITTSTPADLNGKYSIFGDVVKGYDVVEAIAATPVSGSRPTTDVRIVKVTISDTLPGGAPAAQPKGAPK